MKKLFIFLILHFPLLAMGQVFVRSTLPVLSQTLTDARSVHLLDVDLNGHNDIFITNGPAGGQADLLLLNQGKGVFVNAPESPLTSLCLPSVGAAFADFNNDGLPDVMVTSWYKKPNTLFRNLGGGLFEAVGDPGLPSYAEAVSFADVDKDGWPDMLVTHSEGDMRNPLFANRGGTGFSLEESLPLEGKGLPSRGILWGEINGDGWPDLYVLNEGKNQNSLYYNNGNGKLVQVPEHVLTKATYSAMGASWGDIDNDGQPDLFVANAGYFQEQPNQLFMNKGHGVFEEVTQGDVVQDGGCSYGSAFADVDNDGDLDLIVSNGYCNGNNVLFFYRNDGQGKLVREHGAIDFPALACGYGLALADLTGNGFPDLVVATCVAQKGGQPSPGLFFKNAGNSNNWAKFKLSPQVSNRSGIGAVIRVLAVMEGKPVWQMRDVSTQSGYAGQGSFSLHFGLGTASVIDSAVVEWPNGAVSRLERLPVNQTHTLAEPGAGGTKSWGLKKD